MKKAKFLVLVVLLLSILSFSTTIKMYLVTDYHSHAIPFYSEGQHGFGGIAKIVAFLKDKTGDEEEVRDFLDASPRVQEFWNDVQSLVDGHVEEFIERAFSSLTVSFGCKGGRHRSVYMARRLAIHLTRRYPQVRIRLAHTKL